MTSFGDELYCKNIVSSGDNELTYKLTKPYSDPPATRDYPANPTGPRYELDASFSRNFYFILTAGGAAVNRAQFQFQFTNVLAGAYMPLYSITTGISQDGQVYEVSWSNSGNQLDITIETLNPVAGVKTAYVFFCLVKVFPPPG
jgi:hypothetical protein